MTGEIEVEDRVLVIKRIHVTYHLQVDVDADTDAIHRAHDAHVGYCPVARSIGGSIDITTDLELETTA